jgi:hypothetical protein
MPSSIDGGTAVSPFNKVETELESEELESEVVGKGFEFWSTRKS